jgi:hypothetical protein
MAAILEWLVVTIIEALFALPELLLHFLLSPRRKPDHRTLGDHLRDGSDRPR